MDDSHRFPARRLLTLAVVSVCLHLATLAWLERHAQRQQRAPTAALLVRLAPPSGTPAAPHGAAPSAPAVASPEHAAAALESAAPAPPAPAPAPAPVSSLSGATLAETPPGGADDVGEQMPGRYNVRLPPPVELSFDVLEGVTMAPRAEPSRLSWQSDGQRYSLRFASMPNAYGGGATTLVSAGGVNDGGVAPDSMLELPEGGAETRIDFDREAGRIAFSSGRTVSLSHSTQDTASLLIQLSGIALANPDQMNGTVEFEVAGSAGHSIVRFDVSGPEQLTTPRGALTVWRLTQQRKAGEPTLEVWLAPALSWYPVQLRTSGPNGIIALQRLRSASASPAAPSPASAPPTAPAPR